MGKEAAFDLLMSIGIGKEHAVKRPMSGDREFRDLIKLERDKGTPIIPSKDGYYIVDETREDEVEALRAYILQECHRNYEKRKSIMAMKRTLREYERHGRRLDKSTQEST